MDVAPGDVLRQVLLLLHGEHVLHKELLKVLIGEVDAELLKAVESTAPSSQGTTVYHAAPAESLESGGISAPDIRHMHTKPHAYMLSFALTPGGLGSRL